MSKQEIYAWSSFGLTLAIFSYYLLAVFGWPAGLENYAHYVTGIIWKVVVAAFAVEFFLDLLKSTKYGGIDKDERDQAIESKGFRNAYYFVMVAIVTLIGHLLISDFLSEASGEQTFLSVPFMTFHVLVFIVFITSLIKSATQLFYYKRGV